MTPHRTVALIVAAGRGTRAGEGLPKQYRTVSGRAVLRHSAEALARHPAIDEVRIVIHPDDRLLHDAAVAGLSVAEPIDGGATRQDSVRLGLEAIASVGGCRYVLIHDAARPFFRHALVDRLLDALTRDAGAVPALPIVDSLRRGNTHVEAEVDRAGLHRVQTPQAFRFDDILAAHRSAQVEATDDAAVLRAAGGAVALVMGDEAAFKITTPEDFARAEHHVAVQMISRTGSGYDVHRFGPGDHVWLCGVQVAHGAGLIGHSDADVGLHALTDALLGAIGEGDIGHHFPPSDPRWRGASSDRFLVHARDLVRERRGRIDHVDVTIVAERPKVGPHRDAMRARIAELLELPLASTSVKATTTEGLGFTGRSEGIAAQAVATVRLPSGDFT
jgi:2-C-methyl-D-erythritol 4-phosphate cytidylyltransferase/2-C-methyl-D-erythritol 2,4-cyclodiphosphate synthase